MGALRKETSRWFKPWLWKRPDLSRKIPNSKESKSQKSAEKSSQQAFNMSHLFDEFETLVKKHGVEAAKVALGPQLEKQLRTFHQEFIVHPFTITDYYDVIWDAAGSFTVEDPDYPLRPDVVGRAKYGWENAIKIGAPDSTIERYRLEYEQIKKLIAEVLPTDPVLAPPLLASLAENLPVIDMTLPDGQKTTGVVGNWHALAMPPHQVHGGKDSFLNIYRVIAVPSTVKDKYSHDGWRYVIETKGYLHSLDWQTQVDTFLNLDQTDHFSPTNEMAFMMRILTLGEDWSRDRKNNLKASDPRDVLFGLGALAGDTELFARVAKADHRQAKQNQDLLTARQAILAIFVKELLATPFGRAERLQKAFGAIGNAIGWQVTVPGKEIADKYDILTKGGSADTYYRALSGALPTIGKRIMGVIPCGDFDFGGFVEHGMGKGSSGLFERLPNGELCPVKRCRQCGNTKIGLSDTSCHVCSWVPGTSVNKQWNSSASSDKKGSLSKTKVDQSNKKNIHNAQPKLSVGLGQVLSGQDHAIVDLYQASDAHTAAA
ncbi:MAG TPA: hypothetical protein VD999_02330 [Vitreimonas sp.]|nr:hypothetical protein [Vitreimonas sp.]